MGIDTASIFQEKLDILYSNADWQTDKKERFEIKELTHNFHQTIPILRYLNWDIKKIDRGFCESYLPLTAEGSNQHITQQAALMLLAADYTGGMILPQVDRQLTSGGF
jgi:hypothetical protein